MLIHNPNKLPTIDYRLVKPLQENLKDLDTSNHDKLLRVLEKRGFTTPLFLWWGGGDFYLLDGHQRQRVMQLNELRDETLPADQQHCVPYILVEAADIKTAKEMLLEITSQYGTMTVDGLDEFAALSDLDLASLDVNFDAINFERLVGEMDDGEAAETIEKSKTAKLSSWTLEELQDRAITFREQTGGDSLSGFLDWLL